MWLSFDEYQQRHVLEPLKMHETWFFTPDDQHYRIAAVYEAGRDEKVTEARPRGLGMLAPQASFSPHHTYFSGAGGLHGTTADYFRFAQMLFNNGELEGVRVLSPTSVRLMTTNQIGDLCNWQRRRTSGATWSTSRKARRPLGFPALPGRARCEVAEDLLHEVRETLGSTP